MFFVLFCFISISYCYSQSCTITITNSSIGGSAVLGSNNYNSGIEKTWTQNGVSFAGKDITCNPSNTPSSALACQYIQVSNRGLIYNKTALAGRITSIQATGTNSALSYCLGGIFKLVNSTTGSYGSSGSYIGTSPQTTTTYNWTASASDNYNYFCVQRGGTLVQYFSSIVINHEPAVVSYNSNGGVGSMSNQTSCSSSVLTSNTFTRAGYTFSGWNTASDGSETSYNNGASFPFNESKTMYAIWTPNNITVSYNVQGGSTISNGNSVSNGTLQDPGTPTKSGYNFSGWYTASSGGSPITFPYNHGQISNFTLYAQWTVAYKCPSSNSILPSTDQTVCKDNSTTTITASPAFISGIGNPTVQYQWYYNSTNSNLVSGATSITGANAASFSPPSNANAIGTRYYFCVAYATDNNCLQTATSQSLASSVVKILVNPRPSISIETNPSSAFACLGSSVQLTATQGMNNYSWSSGSSTTNIATFSPTSHTTYTVTGTDANGCSASSSKTIFYYPASSSASIVSTSISGAIEQCTESNGWTYYAHPAIPGQYIFAIYKNGNNFTASVDITVDNSNVFSKSTSSNGANQEHASYIMSRYWDVNATGNIGSGVKVRFFFNNQDKIDLLNERDADYNTLKNVTNVNSLAIKSDFEWFKTIGVPYNHTNWIGNKYGSTIVKLTEDAVGTLNGLNYVELSGITSFSGGTGGAAFGPSSSGLINGGGTIGLPVTWKEITANVKDVGNLIKWMTSNEKNTSHFEVEYSYDSKNFIKASKEIKASGNSSTENLYEFMHLEEFGEMVFYRIKQIDLDGKIDISRIINVKRTSKLPEFHVLMYPVPLNVQDLTLNIQTVQKTNLVISISDLLGREVYNETIAPNAYSINHKMNLTNLQQGTYNVTINNGSNKTTQVLVISR